MSILSSRPLALTILSLALAACANPEPAAAIPTVPVLGVDLGSSGPVTARAAESQDPVVPPRSNIQQVHEGHVHAQGTGTVNSVDAAGHKLNIAHQPIPAIGFPAMTMDFAVAPTVNLGAIKPGSQVNFTIEQGAGGMYVIQSITPAAGAGR
jgi:Cu/Ag efflux protein CusF